MIEIEGVSKRFGEILALDNISLTVETGQVVGFLGANGAGKTTTMDIVCGCLGPDEGTVRIGGFDILEQPLEAKSRLGYLPDVPPLYTDMTAEESIRYAGKLNRVPSTQLPARTQWAMERLDILNVSRRLVGNLSKGYRQRVALAQALIHDPDVLVLDEPTEGLDPNQIRHIRDLIADLKSDHTIILSSHILSEVESICDHIAIIDQGKLIQFGTREELTRATSTSTEYGLRVKRREESLIHALSHIDGLTVRPGATSQEFDLILEENDDRLDDAMRIIVSEDFGLASLTPRDTSLEDIFVKLTK